MSAPFRYLSLGLAGILLGGCSYKTSEFFEDLIADNKVVKAEGQYKGSVDKDARAPILPDKKSQRKNIADRRMHSYRGKIAAVRFDRDFNLYTYTFIDNITHEPITFYYDKNIQQSAYKGDYRIKVSGNYLIKYEMPDKSIKFKEAAEVQQRRTPIRVKSYKRRKRSSIKVPEEEKISPL